MTPHQALELFLAHRDVPCPGCEYNLRGLTGETCPECGEALELRVGMVEPKLGSFITGLIGLACGAGFHAMVLLWAVSLMVRRQGGPSLRDVGLLTVGFVLCGTCLALWLRGRSRVRKSPPNLRYSLVAGCWLLSLLTAGLFFWQVR